MIVSIPVGRVADATIAAYRDIVSHSST